MTALGAAAGGLSGGPESLFQWLMLPLAAVIAGIAPYTPVVEYLTAYAARLLRRMRPTQPLRRRRLLLIGLALVIAAGFGRLLTAGAPELVEVGRIRLLGCPATTELRLLTTEEGRTTAVQLAEAYARHTAGERHGCPGVRPYVEAMPPEAAADALRSGWSANHLRTLGPRPDLWLPGSSRYELTGTPATSNGRLTRTETRQLASTPVVLAVPTASVPADLRARQSDLTWAEAMDRVDDLGWGVARPDPASSVTGEIATAAMYASGRGEPGRLGEATTPPDLVAPARAREIEHRVAGALDAAGLPLADAVDLLCRHRERWDREPPRADVALAITEQQLVTFNTGRPLGGRCPGQISDRADHALFALYPTDTLSLDHPLIRLYWADQAAQTAARIESFLAWLGGPAGAQVLNRTGLRPARPAGWSVGDPLSERWGALPGVSYSQVRLTARTLQEVRETWQAAKRPGRVLLLLDASGSMRESVGSGQRRFDVAAQAVVNLADRMGDRDEFGLWVFQGPRRQPAELVPIGPPYRIAETLETVQVGGNTPLYRAVVDGVAGVGPADPARSTALVVVTDGADEGSDVSADQMVRSARAAGVRVFVIAVGEARCAVKPIDEVTTRSGGGCHETDVANLDARLGTLLDTLWEGGSGR